MLPEIRRIRHLEKSRTSPTHAEKARTSPTHGLRKVYTCVTSRTARMTAERRARQRDASERRGELGGQHRDSGNVLLLARARSQHGYVVVGSSTAGRSLQPRPHWPGFYRCNPSSATPCPMNWRMGGHRTLHDERRKERSRSRAAGRPAGRQIRLWGIAERGQSEASEPSRAIDDDHAARRSVCRERLACREESDKTDEDIGD